MEIEIGSFVLYGASGVCRVEDRSMKQFGETEREYFTLAPIHTTGSAIYVPTDNEALRAKMKKILSEEEIRTMIRGLPKEEPVWDEVAANRKELFKQILEGGDRLKLMNLIRTLWQKQKERATEGKKLWAFEQYALDAAQKNLHEEFALVLKLKKDEVAAFIAKELGE